MSFRFDPERTEKMREQGMNIRQIKAVIAQERADYEEEQRAIRKAKADEYGYDDEEEWLQDHVPRRYS